MQEKKSKVATIGILEFDNDGIIGKLDTWDLAKNMEGFLELAGKVMGKHWFGILFR